MKMKQFAIILIIFLILTFVICPYSFAENTVTPPSMSEIFTGADNFVQQGQSANYLSQENMQNISELVYNILFVISIIVAIILGIMLGIKYMTGSIEEQAKVKESLIPYIVGCVVVFGAFTIWKIVVTMVQGLPSA